MSERHRMANRRENIGGPVELQDGDRIRAAHVQYGYQPEDPGRRIREIFIRPKGAPDSEIARLMDDVGVLLSLLLQHGVGFDELAARVGRQGGYPRISSEGAPERRSDRPPASLIGRIVDVGVERQAELDRETEGNHT